MHSETGSYPVSPCLTNVAGKLREIAAKFIVMQSK